MTRSEHETKLGYRAALARAEQHIVELSRAGDAEFVLIPEATLGRWFGFVFFYTTRSFLETGDDMERPIGNAPFIVDTQDGSIITTTTAEPIEQFLERYARERRAARR